jgi:hypothetical protein
LRIPAEFRLLGHTIPVLFEHIEGGDYGTWDTEDFYVALNENMKGTIVGETYCHEIIEAMNDIMELHIDHATIQRLGAGLHQILTTSYYPRRKK